MVRSYLLICCALATLLLVMPTAAYPSLNNYYRDENQYDPEELMFMLDRIGNLIQMEHKMESLKDQITRSGPGFPSSEKRAVDFGLGRGYSGALQAKHLMGLKAAASETGPGRRRRNAL